MRMRTGSVFCVFVLFVSNFHGFAPFSSGYGNPFIFIQPSTRKTRSVMVRCPLHTRIGKMKDEDQLKMSHLLSSSSFYFESIVCSNENRPAPPTSSKKDYQFLVTTRNQISLRGVNSDFEHHVLRSL